jgi:A/G-specific adenine glycosylase
VPTPRVAAIRRAVLASADGSLRALPWRSTRDPWSVLVSELMLQQTQAARVVEPYRAFLARFPHPASCAAAPVGEVLRAWSGLGYNRRATCLHAAASAIVEHHGGVVPDSLEELLALPGIGPYTARAVLAFAFERHVAVVDVNVARVLGRAVAGETLSATAAQDLADGLVPEGRSWEWNQSLLEHGALWCTARAPRCGACALRRSCAWRCAGCPDPDPGRRAARQSRFEGSDRQGRGRLLAALCRDPVPSDALATVCGWPDDPGRAARIADGLVHEGLARRGPKGTLRLP